MIPEELLCEAATGSCEAYVSQLTADFDAGESFVFSNAFEKKIEKLKRRADHPVLYRTVRRAAAILLAILFAGMVWISVDADARAVFFGWFNEVIGNSFVYHHNESANGNTKPVDYRPLWIPDGYSENTVNVFVDETTVLYKSEAKGYLRFSYIISLEKRTWYLDITDADIKDCCVNAQPAQLFISKLDSVASGITWTTEDSVFLITGFVSEEELLKMAESVQRIIYLPTWIPEGYAEKSVRVFNDKTTVLYGNGSGELLRFSYVITNREYHWSFDVSQGETVDGQVGDRPATLFRSHDEKTAGAVTWIGADDTAFYVTGFISEEDLLRMAESVDQP